MWLAHSGAGQPVEEVTSLLLIGDTVLVLWLFEKRGKAKNPMSKRRTWLLGGVVAAVLAVAVTTPLWLPKKSTSTGPRRETSARIAIRSPQSGATVGHQVPVKIELIGGTLVGTNVVKGPDGGHIHLLLDGEILSQSLELEQTVKVDKAGAHTITAEYVQADHQPFKTPVQASVFFTVRP
jgi:hypothetical protein